MVPPATMTSPATAVTAALDGEVPTAKRTSTSVPGDTNALMARVKTPWAHTIATIVPMVTMDLDVSITATSVLVTAA